MHTQMVLADWQQARLLVLQPKTPLGSFTRECSMCCCIYIDTPASSLVHRTLHLQASAGH